MKNHVLVCHHYHEQYAEILRGLNAGLEVDSIDYRDPLSFELHPADILFCWHIPAGIFDRMPNLKWVASIAAGIDHILTSLPKDRPVVLTRAIANLGEYIANYVATWILHFALDVPRIYEQQEIRKWRFVAPQLASNRTVGILGIGAIGREVAQRCRSFGMTVYGARKGGGEIREVDKVFPDDTWKEMLPHCNFLVSTLPATEATDSILGYEEFSLLPEGAVFINVGRGSVVDDDGLSRALNEGKLRAAVLDVFRNEPLPSDHPFWKQKNLIVTPHCAGPTEMERVCHEFHDNLKRWRKGQVMLHVVDMRRGY